MADRMLSVDETAEMIGLSRSRVYQAWGQLGLTGYKIGSRLRFRESEVEAWIDSRKMTGRAALPGCGDQVTITLVG
jgi:excisionase family DNA binding protein